MHEQTKLEKIVMLKLCRSIVYEVLQGVHTPERPSSPAELYITEDQEFLSKNPKVTLTGGISLQHATLFLVISEVVFVCFLQALLRMSVFPTENDSTKCLSCVSHSL